MRSTNVRTVFTAYYDIIVELVFKILIFLNE